ncbi:hypothetical protein DNTS_030476 [Danionella cerebrum]|uniref:Uncharacterized protein n=1 Tax=Danionella cerebrum TaxID=2873325 RepID=A0A553MM10_9TELE|nr:hypothetical protein DNTS_030476 [Danionella translucida]
MKEPLPPRARRGHMEDVVGVQGVYWAGSGEDIVIRVTVELTADLPRAPWLRDAQHQTRRSEHSLLSPSLLLPDTAAAGGDTENMNGSLTRRVNVFAREPGNLTRHSSLCSSRGIRRS